MSYSPPLSIADVKPALHSFSTQDDRRENFTNTHSAEIGQFVKQWGTWVAEKGKLAQLFLPTFNLTFLVLGVGTLEPNVRDDEENEEPTETKSGAWKQLLTDDTPSSLKPWKEVVKATRTNLASALREYMREAWGDAFLFISVFLI